MSEFDKEKERERLREKYEQDKQKREHAEQMSELLLKGATMTNAHCSDCGDPIFRYDGQEFCASCEKPVDRGNGESDSGSVEVAQPSDESRVKFGADQQDAPQDTPHQEQSTTDTQQPPQPQTPAETGGSVPQPQAATGDTDAALVTARDALVQTLVQFSQRAQATDDPQRAREYLRTAREAAETLGALQQE